MFALATIALPAPVSLHLPVRQRVPGQTAAPAPRTGAPRTVSKLDACFRLNSLTRTIHAELPPIPRPLLIYGPDDFAEAAADTPEQHAERVLQVLGPDLATALQSLCDGAALPPPPARVPREIPNWRGKAVLHTMGLLSAVDAALNSLPEPDRTVALLAWNGDAKLARHGKTVLGLAAALGLSDAQVDEIFIQAAGLDV